MRKPIIKRGDKYGRLIAIKFSHRDKGSNQYWLFECNCGKEKVINVDSVKSGKTKSCGCLFKDWFKDWKGNYKHGMRKTKTYKSWESMKRRCLNESCFEYKYYGGRGITVCDEWMKFENFYKDMGKVPDKLTLDRTDNNGNYELNNCRWATRKQQANNRRSNLIN